MSPSPGSLPAAAVAYAERALPPSQSSAGRLPDAAIEAFRNLDGRLRTVFGAEGCDALFRRALARAAAEHSVLETGEQAPTPERLIEALREHLGPDNAAAVAEAVRATMAQQVALLMRFIGEDLVHTILEIEGEMRPVTTTDEAAPADE